VKVDLDGNIVMESDYSINPAGFTIHSAVHGAREDAICVMHLHTDNGIAVSAQENGLLPISQQALFVLASLGYHDYEGLALNDDEKPRLVADLGKNTFLILRNHGLLTVGATVPDAFLSMFLLERACRIQIMAQSGGGKLIPISDQILAEISAQEAVVTQGGRGRLAWPALLRKLERSGSNYQE
jgi:ribulose-5-phosphate 4-epimerase/fuculose-1-phosphate aldolase